MKEDLFSGKLWTKEKREARAPEEPRRRADDNVVPLRADDRAYKAFDTREHPADMQIRCATQPSNFPAYSSLLNIIFDHDFEKAFTLVYSFMIVEVTGNYLGAVVHAISYRTCERIREFHPKLYDRPASDQPIIESITITSAIGK